MFLYWIVISISGSQKLCRWFAPLTADEKQWVLLQVKQQLLLPQVAAEGAAAVAAAAAAALGTKGSSSKPPVPSYQTAQVLTIPPLHPNSRPNSSSSSSSSSSSNSSSSSSSFASSIGSSSSSISSSSSRAVYRQHASLYCVVGINEEETPLVTGEVIELWLRVLQQLLGLAAAAAAEGTGLELQLSLQLEKGLLLLDAMLQQGYLVCTDSEVLLSRVRELLKQD
ncbi:hypothetical protein, conserved [Eimeria brunetti]|uniref:AP complex mu/sigma subunit domain-containing protein n=1 Tax=Eimeria brunetti TaxID=51314 RepID=U6LYK6_9EIME|nr:hypothetical protein, conserved [Eimeria brunetti]